MAKKNSGLVLVVDDEEGPRRITGLLLEQQGYAVRKVPGGWSGIQQVQILGADVALVVLDMVMPDIDGAATFSILRKLQPDLPVLICSGFCDSATRRLLQEPRCAFLAKPYSGAALLGAVERLLDTAPAPGVAAQPHLHPA